MSQTPAEVIGLAVLGRMAFEGADLGPTFNALVQRAQGGDAGALMDVATLLLATGQAADGLRIQADALAATSAFRRKAPGEDALKLLAIMAPGDLMACTPLDFLLEGANVELINWYVRPGEPLEPPPDHDLAFLAIGESEANRPALEMIAPVLRTWPKPMLNGRPERIIGLTRDGVAAALADIPEILAPVAMRMSRADLNRDAAALAYPVLARPIASHAGAGLAKVGSAADMIDYLTERGENDFYVTPFVDYAGPDGLFRKQRIVLIEGRPFICHMAISERWMVHYMNAGMDESADKRAEEARFMDSFDDDFAARHAGAFQRLHAAIGLDYFGIDCAETSDGRLLLFEADVAMIVHAMDPPDPYAYKKPAMARLFAAFEAMLRKAAA